MRRTSGGFLVGKMPTTSARRFTSLLSRSRVLVECSFCRWAAGKVSVFSGTSSSAASMAWASLGRLLCAEAAMARHSSRALAWVGWTKTSRIMVATLDCWALGTRASRLRMDVDWRQRRQVAPITWAMAALRPSCASGDDTA